MVGVERNSMVRRGPLSTSQSLWTLETNMVVSGLGHYNIHSCGRVSLPVASGNGYEDMRSPC